MTGCGGSESGAHHDSIVSVDFVCSRYCHVWGSWSYAEVESMQQTLQEYLGVVGGHSLAAWCVCASSGPKLVVKTVDYLHVLLYS